MPAASMNGAACTVTLRFNDVGSPVALDRTYCERKIPSPLATGSAVLKVIWAARFRGSNRPMKSASPARIMYFLRDEGFLSGLATLTSCERFRLARKGCPHRGCGALVTVTSQPHRGSGQR